MIEVEKFRKMLISAGFEKTYLIEEQPNCIVYMGIYRNKEVIIALFKGISSFYAKIVPVTLILPSHWHCHYIKYLPVGWYVFSNSIDDLVKRLSEKVSKIIELKVFY